MKSAEKYLTIEDLENIPPLGTNYALNSSEVSSAVVSDIISNISPSSINKYYDLNSGEFIRQSKKVLLNGDESENLNIVFFKGIRDSLTYLIKSLRISLVIFPRNSYPGNLQVCKYAGVDYKTYDGAKDLEILMEIYDSNETIIIWEDPGNPEHRGNLSFEKIKKSKIFIDCAYRFPSMRKKENIELSRFFKERVYLAFGFSKSTSIPGSSLSFLLSSEEINNDLYPIKWNIFQASVAATIIRDDIINSLYEETYLKSLKIYAELESYYLSRGLKVYSTLNPCFITIDNKNISTQDLVKLYKEKDIARVSIK